MKFILFFLTSFLVFTFLAYSQEQYYQIQSPNASGLIISFDFDKINISDASQKSSNIKSFEIPGLPANYDDGKPLIPILALPIVIPDGKFTVNVSVEKSKLLDGIFPSLFKDIPNDGSQHKKSDLIASTTKFPDSFYEIKDLGLFRDYRIASLKIYPVQVTGSGVVFYQKFKVNIRFNNLQTSPFAVQPSEAELLKKIIANKSQATFVKPLHQESLQSTYSSSISGFESKVKLIVKDDGIYQIRGSDLEDAGVDISQITPSSFRLTNKGREIAIYIVGDEDQSFEPSDYIEFWGEGNRKTFLNQYSDLYTDPFSDENVYWLEWGGNAGLRMVEENGSKITNNPTQYNPSPFFRYKVHIEENNHFERLGNSNLDKLSHTRDSWFFDSGVKSVGRKQYFFNLVYPDSTSLFNPVYVDVMLAGKSSTGGHHVVAWINNDIIGSSDPNWIGQDTSRITNRPTSTMRSFDLAHGQNLFELQLPTAVQSGTDIALLNWFEVSYDRQYRASNNYIDFTRPSLISFPKVNLFQFDLEGFSRPDIEIYKKDISKIVNFDIQLEVKNNRNTYNVSFQDNILSGDIEYVALTEDRKKKPIRIELDKPFDPENPQKILKDPTNSADYLIITHSRFYDTALRLRDYRRDQGIDVELVNVEDIYDEFNFGIKSPLAIKSFLQYAYRNWNQNHKLKYVLFLGDANYNYKATTGVNADLVPTFFYQTIEFGAVATDFPYSLISGNDLIPDLFIGRIPVSTNSDVIVVIDKIIEYEQNPTISQWRNQALFISGNDASTFEFGNPSRPLFRTQNSRVVMDEISNNTSSFRLNAIRDTSLNPDPNFGSTTDLIEYFDDGVFMINFLGHGGGGIWSDVKLMGLSDINRLNNQGKYPFITSMTCFTGAFDNPGDYGLAQKLVMSSEKGAIGVLASSGLGWAYNDFSMLWSVDQYLFDRSLSVGEAITLGKIYYLSTRFNYYVNDTLRYTPQHETGNFLGDDMAHQYNLIGDPYIRIARSPDYLSLSSNNNNPQAGDTLQVSIESPFAPAEGYVEIADNKNNIVNRLPIFTSDFNSTVTLPIPSNYREGTGIVRAYLSDGSQDASGLTRIGVNYAAIDSIVIIPENPDADDSVYVKFKVQDAQGIQRVYLLKQNNFVDTLFAQEVEPGVFQTVHPFAPIHQIGTVFYTIYVENSIGNKSIFRNHKYKVFDERPDIFVYAGSLSFTGREKTQIQVYLGNLGGSTAQNSPVYFYDGYDNYKDQQSFAISNIDIQPGDSIALIVDFPLDLSRGEFRIYAQIDPLNTIQDFNRGNNVDSSLIYPTIFNLTPQLGSTYSNISSDTISTDSAYRVYFAPGSVDKETAVRIRLMEFDPPADQPGLKPLPIINPSKYHGVEVQLLNPAAQLLSPFNLKINLGLAAQVGGFNYKDVKLYEKQSNSQPWLFTESLIDSIHNIVTANASKSSFYAPFTSNDQNAPRIELTVNGRPIQQRAQISSKPVMYVVVEDESGLNFTKNNIRILMDNIALPEEKVFIPDSTKRNNILGITVYPELNSGEHRFSVQISDVNGNLSEKEWQLVVSDEFDVHVFGNYPNPFADYTVFSYFVTPDVLDEFEIRIFTVSGRLIKRLTDDENTVNDPRGFGARNVGYNELIWDGTDEGGTKVANGVYFALIRAKYQDETKEEILKVAKLK